MIEDNYLCCYREYSNTRLEHWFSKCYLFREFRIKYSMDMEKLYEKLFIISKYCPKSNINVNTVITDMNNIESNIDSDRSNKVYNINNNINRNNYVNNSKINDRENRNINISDSEYNSIVTKNVVNKSIGENRVNISNFLNNECENM